MYPFTEITSLDYRVGRLQYESAQRRMVRAARAGSMVRIGPFRGAIGNGLIALGERLTEPPSVDEARIDRAA